MTAQLLDTTAVAERIGLARQTLAKLRVTGGGPPFRKIGSRVLYPADELDQWVDSHALRTKTTKRLPRRSR